MTLRLARACSLFVALVANSVFAFSLESAVTTGCHERISLAALEQSGWPMPAPAQTGDDEVAIVREHRGTLSLESEVGSGTEVVLDLPAQPSFSGADQAQLATATP